MQQMYYYKHTLKLRLLWKKKMRIKLYREGKYDSSYDCRVTFSPSTTIIIVS